MKNQGSLYKLNTNNFSIFINVYLYFSFHSFCSYSRYLLFRKST